MAQSKPYGSWESPITASLVASYASQLRQVIVDGNDAYWLELRPDEGGRYVAMKQHLADLRDAAKAPAPEQVTPLPFNVRTRVHEYGGAPHLVVDGTLYFSHFADARIYRQRPGHDPEPLTPDNGLRYADMAFDPTRNRLICVVEKHAEAKVDNFLGAIDLRHPEELQTLVSGCDFYSNPRISPDGKTLSWLQWNHPDMPFDATELWTGSLSEDGAVSSSQYLAGGNDESVFQPEWSQASVLHFVSDKTGWWNLYRWRNEHAEPLWETQAEFGLAQWIFGLSTYAFTSAEQILCTYCIDGVWYLANLDTSTGQSTKIPTEFSHIDYVRAAGGYAVFIGSSPTQAPAVVALDLKTHKPTLLQPSSRQAIAPKYLSRPEALTVPTKNGRNTHAFYYPPANADFEAPAGTLPPLVVNVHGGPTLAVLDRLEPSIQFWTSRGFAFVDVNYGGSTGYGSAYRHLLRGEWGVVDVDDSIAVAQFLVEQGKVDPGKVVIRGGSAGGYSVLCALCFHDFFQAGADYFGISDLVIFAGETHKFELHYTDRLIGPYPARMDLYESRSPIRAADRITRPVIVFQGLEDMVVPANQSELIVSALKARGVPVAYRAYEGEQHGFRKKENIQDSLECELTFYARVLGLPISSPTPNLQIDNFPLGAS